VGLAELDVGGAGQLVCAKLGGVSFEGGGGVSAREGAVVWHWRGGVSGVGLAELDVGGTGQLVGAKLGGVSFEGGGGVSAGEGAAVWHWRGGVSAGEGADVCSGMGETEGNFW
jgi:hypothetical protein